MSPDRAFSTGTWNNIDKLNKKKNTEKKWSNTIAAPDLRHLILVGEFGCQGNRAPITAEVPKYIFDEIVQNGGKKVNAEQQCHGALV